LSKHLDLQYHLLIFSGKICYPSSSVPGQQSLTVQALLLRNRIHCLLTFACLSITSFCFS